MPITSVNPSPIKEGPRRGESSPVNHRYLVVKFQDKLTTLPDYADNLEHHFEQINSPEWRKIAELAPGATFRRIYRALTPGEINELTKLAKARDPKYKPPQFLKNYLLILPPASPVKSVLTKLRAWKIVDRAYVAPQVVDPMVNDRDDPHAGSQRYLGPAPLGINARYAWQHKGDGKNQELIDIEQGWTLAHEDLVDSGGNPRVKLLAGVMSPASCPHGTKVLGVICASDNTIGCVGIAPNTDNVRVISHGGYAFNIPEAIKIAAQALTPGGIILLEVTLRLGEGQPILPAEVDPLTFDEIELAITLGHVVIEAAGNGNFSLDKYEDLIRPAGKVLDRNNSEQFLDSGAIMVGAGWRLDENATNSTPWSRRLDSNYGSRVDCFAWGDSVETTNSTPLQPLQAYESNFNGTSSASAIVAGAALCLQGMARQQTGQRLDPATVRDHFSDPGINTPTIKPPIDQIGVMPDLGQIGHLRLELPAP